jgi:hypothetical protein
MAPKKQERKITESETQAFGPLQVNYEQATHGENLVVEHPARGIVAWSHPLNPGEYTNADDALRQTWDISYLRLFAAAPAMRELLKQFIDYFDTNNHQSGAPNDALIDYVGIPANFAEHVRSTLIDLDAAELVDYHTIAAGKKIELFGKNAA